MSAPGATLAAGGDRAPRGPIDSRLLRLAPSLRAHLVRSVLLAVGLAAAVLVQAEVIGRHLPRLVLGDRSAVAPLALSLISVALARWILRDLTERSASAAVSGTRRSLTRAVLDHVGDLDEAGAAAATPSRVTSVLTTGMDALDPWIRTYLPALCVAAIVPVVAWTRILLADPLSALVLAVAVPLIPVFMVLIGQYTQERTDRQWAALQRLTGHFHDVLTGLVTLRLFGRAEAQVDGVRASAERYRRAVMRTLRVAFLSALALELLATLSVALVAVEVGIRLSAGSMVLGTGLVVLLLAPEVSLPIRRVGAAYHAGLTGLDAAAEVSDLLELGTTPDGRVGHLDHHEVSLRSVEVVDPERGHRAGPVELTASAGQLVALVGPSGSGKSTVLEVLRGRVSPSAGEARIGGLRVEELARTTRGRAVVHVSQTPSPVGADVARSVLLGAPDAGAAAVEALLDRLGLGGRGAEDPAELSGGELRRVTLARAALRVECGGASVVLADEPTSHLDPELRATVVDLLREMARRGATVLVATHDPMVMAAADHRVVLDPGTGSRVDGLEAAGMSQPGADAALPHRLAATGLALPSSGGSAVSDPAAPGFGLLDEMRWLRSLGGPTRARVAGARLLGVAADACTVGLAATAAWLIVRASQQPSFADLAVAAVAVRAFGLGKGVLRYAERLASHDATFRQLGSVRAAVVARLAAVVPAGLPHLSRGDLMARVVDDVDRLADMELRVVSPAVSAVSVGLLGAAGLALAIPSAGAVLAAMVLAGGALLPAGAARSAAALAPRRVEAGAELAGATMGLVEHLDELVGADAVATPRGHIDGVLDELSSSDRTAGRRMGRWEGAASALGAAGAAATVVALGVVAGAPTGPLVGVAVLVPLAVAELLAPLVQSGSLRASVAASGHRLRVVLSAPDPVHEPPVPVPIPPSADVALHALSARWPAAAGDAIHDVDLSLPEGEVVCITGPSGSGKSTLAATLVRFLEPREGEYLLGGVPTEELGGEQVRRVVTWVPQHPWLGDTSVRENLCLARPGATEADLEQALRQVDLLAWVRALPQGLDTLLGQGGASASGGQRQRLSLARALLAQHRVVVLDEPTAQLDRDTADRVLEAVAGALDGRSVVVLGHRVPESPRWAGAPELRLGREVESALA